MSDDQVAWPIFVVLVLEWVDAIAHLANVDVQSITGLAEKRKTQGRVVYEWNPPGKAQAYVVVVSRPYWLSFYAQDPKRVAWVVLASYPSSSSKDNAVTRSRK